MRQSQYFAAHFDSVPYDTSGSVRNTFSENRSKMCPQNVEYRLYPSSPHKKNLPEKRAHIFKFLMGEIYFFNIWESRLVNDRCASIRWWIKRRPERIPNELVPTSPLHDHVPISNSVKGKERNRAKPTDHCNTSLKAQWEIEFVLLVKKYIIYWVKMINSMRSPNPLDFFCGTYVDLKRPKKYLRMVAHQAHWLLKRFLQQNIFDLPTVSRKHL